MSYVAPDDGPNSYRDGDEDITMNEAVDSLENRGADEEEEGEGDEVRPKGLSDDSSEEEEEDEEAERRIRDGFIVDEDEEEEEEEDAEEERRRRKKRRKHKHRRREIEEDLDEEDLELLEENTGGRVGRSRHLTRLRRGRDSESGDEGSSSKRKTVVESSDDDLDQSNIIGSRQIQDIQNIWDDEGGKDDDDDMDMDDFIDDEEEEEEGAGAMAEEEREERRRERRRLEKERRRKAMMGSRIELTGIDKNTWDEIQEVFGDGHDYDWALEEDEEGLVEDVQKLEMTYQDVFEPKEIKNKMLTEDDDVIRSYDIPERMQLATSTLSQDTQLSIPEVLTQSECVEAAAWVAPRLVSKERDFFMQDGRYHHLLRDLVEAVTRTLEYLLVQHLEVPYIYAHRRDYISYFNPRDPRARVELLNQEDLWRIYSLGQKYRSLCERQKSLQATYERLGAKDDYYEETLKSRLDSVETVADVTQWLAMKYKSKKKDDAELRFHDDEEQVEAKKQKLPVRMTAYEFAKKSLAAKLAEAFGIKSYQIVLNYMTDGHNVHFVEDADLPPIALADQYVDPDPTKARPAEDSLRQARMILATELSADPILRQEIRKLFKAHGQISTLPTERGKSKIDEFHSYNNFKYLLNKPIPEMLKSIQYLNICTAEADHLMTVSVSLPNDIRHEFEQKLRKAFASDSYSDTAKAWNEERDLVIQDAVERLIPIGVKWVRDYLREEVEDYLAKACGDAFYEKINVAPFVPPNLHDDESASVLAVSWGKGDPKTDQVHAVFLDEAGRQRDAIAIDNLTEDVCKDELVELVKRRKPDVIVVGGLTMQTTKLMQSLKELIGKAFGDPSESVWGDERNDQSQAPPVIYVQDEVARIFQHSKRAEEDFPTLTLTGRYCAGLARFTQSPLNEYAALGHDLTAITFDEEAQPLVPKEKLLLALERALVDVVNKVGVDINRAANEDYYLHLLPYVAGLGPRKSQALINKIRALGGNLVNREQFIKASILTTKIFLNAAGFLRIAQDPDYKEPKGRGSNVDYSSSPDPLDDTRIHPEDYELARKMATDALELDEEDVHDEHPSHVVSVLMKDDDNNKKLDELNLDEFAVNMYETSRDLKRHTLNVIRSELVKPFGELRPKFNLPGAWEVLTMLSGETQRTLRVGLIVSVLIVKINKNYVLVRLDSGIEGVINANYLSDQPAKPESVVFKGQTIPGVIIDVKTDLEQSQFSVELSSRPSDVQRGDGQLRRVNPDDSSNTAQADRDFELLQRKKRAEVNRTRRVIKHPNFHNFNSGQAENYLDKQQLGEVVIRPSSKGTDHLAVTWKVADKLYQHIDVIERITNIGGQQVSTLIVDGKYEYADLDELIVSHIHAMARRVEELMNHEKFKKDDDELQKFLVNFVSANPSKSIYGFTLNRKKPGHFNLSFLAKKGSSIQTWPVRITPEAYYLFDAGAVGIPELCDAFKVRHLHESQKVVGAGGAGGKTPYGAGRMTPAHTPGYATPGRLSVRHPTRTPNPYAAPTPSHQPAPPMAPPPVPPPYGSSYGATPTTPMYGYQTPAPGYGQQPPPPPPGMNPARAAMIQNSGGASAWAPSTGGRW